MSVLKGMPFDKTLANWLLGHMQILVDKNAANGVAVIMPLFAGNEDAWIDQPIPNKDVVTVATHSGDHRPYALSETGYNAFAGTYDDTGTAITDLIERHWWGGTEDSSSGSFLDWIDKQDYQARYTLTAHFKFNATTTLNVMESGNFLRRFMQEDLGLFTDTFDPAEWSEMVRSIPVMDAKDYFAKNYGYLNSPYPIHRSWISHDESNDVMIYDDGTLYGGMGPSILQPFGNDDDNSFQLSTDDYLQSLINTSLATAAAAPEIPYAMVYGATTGITDIAERQVAFESDDIETYFILAGIDHNLGALDPDADNDTMVEYQRLAGKYTAVRTFQRFLNNGTIWCRNKDEVYDILSSDPNWVVNRLAFDQGVICWYPKIVSPIIDVNDPFQHGVFPILSTENVTNPYSWEHAFVNDLIYVLDPADAGTWGDAKSTTSGGNVDVSSENGWIQDYALLKDALGPFIGDAFDQSVNLHLARNDIARYCARGDFPDDSVCLIPAKPFTKITPVQVRDNIVLGEDRYGAGLAYDAVTNHDYAMTTTSSSDNDLLAAADLRFFGARYWDVRSFISGLVNVPVTLQNMVFEGFKRVIDMTNPPAPGDLLYQLPPPPTGSTADLAGVAKSVLDIFIPRGNKFKSDSRGRGSSRSSSRDSRSSGKRSFGKRSFKSGSRYTPKSAPDMTMKPEELSQVADPTTGSKDTGESSTSSDASFDKKKKKDWKSKGTD
jgi:hypothetical protein